MQAGTKSWKALLFGSLDAGNAITVDKPPASLWVMGLSARMFGFSSWSVLAPQAVEGVLSVGLLFAAVRRWSGPVAGLLADRNGEVAGSHGSLRDFGFLKFAKRNTFLIDPQGKVAKVYLGVNPSRNTAEVTADLKRLAAA